MKERGIDPSNVSQPLKQKKIPRRRCKNCNGWYWKTRKNKLFCKKSCKDEYGRYGAAYGPLKAKLEKLIANTVAAAIAGLTRRLDQLEARLVSE